MSNDPSSCNPNAPGFAEAVAKHAELDPETMLPRGEAERPVGKDPLLAAPYGGGSPEAEPYAASALGMPDADSIMNRNLRVIDIGVQDADADPAKQMGLLMMAMILAVRRLMAQHKIADRGKRHAIIKAATLEFDKKLRKFTGGFVG